jgi:hypothetical protein
VTIREARPAEADAVLQVWREAAEATRTDDVASVGAAIAAHHAAFLVAEDEGRIVGTLIAGWDGWRGNFYRLAAIVFLSRDPAVGFWTSAGYKRHEGSGRFTKTIQE